jgi:catechol 2,3-dioxygenase-like lactoylglutathione lyase family enzyme
MPNVSLAIEFAVMQRVLRFKHLALQLFAACLVVHLTAPAAMPQQPPKRPLITGIDHVTIYVSAVAKSRKFYSDVLGLKAGCPQYSGPETCFLVRGSEQRVLLKPVPHHAGPKSWLAETAFATKDLAQMRSYLLAHRVQPGPIQKATDGAQYFRVRDPEGNSIAFVQRATSKSSDAESSPLEIGAPTPISAHLIHAGFVVKDMAAENRFYVDLLGFRLYWYGGFKDDGTDWYELQVPDGPDWIEYMLNIPANADHKELGVQNHFSFGVKDVHATAAKLRASGLQAFDGPEIGRDGKDSLDAYDPDGTRVEIMEFTPAQKPCCHPYTAEHPKP